MIISVASLLFLASSCFISEVENTKGYDKENDAPYIVLDQC